MCSCAGSCDCNSITIPRGPQGPIGETGPQGSIGNTGPRGFTGLTGPQGFSGVVSVEAPITNTGTSNFAILGIDIDELVTLINTTNTGGGFVPTGSIIGFGGATAPAGWMICGGGVVSTTGIYAALYAVIGITYGNGNGDGLTFNLPNLKSSVPVGYDFTAPLFNTLGNAAGNLSVALGQPNLPPHTHTNTFAVTGTGSHDHYSRQTVSIGEGGSDFKVPKIDAVDDGTGGRYQLNSLISGSDGSHTHGISGSVGNNDSAGTFNSTPFSILQPYLVINYIIKL